jgi:hypothetical protein
MAECRYPLLATICLPSRLVADELVRVIYEDWALVEERYMDDPAAWGDEWPENPPIYEAVDM